jgi:hypothetical protein
MVAISGDVIRIREEGEVGAKSNDGPMSVGFF